jgi:hypothetical protein
VKVNTDDMLISTKRQQPSMLRAKPEQFELVTHAAPEPA